MPGGYVPVADISRPLGLHELPQESSGRIVLQGPRGGRIALFPGSTQVTVRGTRLSTTFPVMVAEGTAWVDPSDASRVRRAWGATAGQATPVVHAPRIYTPTPGYAPSPRYTPTTPNHDFRLPPPVVTRRRPPPVAPVPAAANSPTPVERAQWSASLRRRWTYVVVHHSATARGSAASFDEAHRKKGWDGLGYDFVIGNGSGSPDGRVETGFRWTQQRDGAHAGNDLMNQHGIGICLVGDFSKSSPTAPQMRALERLCGFLAAYCGIPPQNLRLHNEFRETACPGAHFPRGFAFRATPGVRRGTVVAAR